ncbi:hypothetical protein GA0116948_11471 [Chitinophaga costaii]|uniref:Uncharacterized protein n=1 Tax=Chitinophaga costaii TaxID=1335309 RepID=A0A1C4FII9_9BACT|nr:hypothetical protein GA0116948_11471 [Chitinophaga costaii]
MATYFLYLFYVMASLWIYRLLVYFYNRDTRTMRKSKYNR